MIFPSIFSTLNFSGNVGVIPSNETFTSGKHTTEIQHRPPTNHGVQVTVEGVSAGDDQGELPTSQQAAGTHLSQTVCRGVKAGEQFVLNCSSIFILF